MQKMEYHIISGKVIETRRCWMPDNRSKRKVRGQKVAGSTSVQKSKPTSGKQCASWAGS